MTTSTVYIGVDIAKKTLDVFHPNKTKKRQSQSVSHDRKGRGKLIKQLRAFPGTHVICEATGGYERTLVTALQDAQIPISVVNPRQVRDFAKSRGVLAKTDKLDARVLAEYGQKNEPKPTPPKAPEQVQLEALVHRRQQLVGMKKMERCRLLQAHDMGIKKMIRSTIRSFETQIEKVEKEMAALVERTAPLQAIVKVFTEVKGIGFISAVSLVANLPELGKVNRGQIAALAGVAPLNCDSGKFKGKRSIWGGREEVRQTLYMVALVASRRNPQFKEFYDRLLSKGKAKKVALVAVMRKMLIFLNALMKTHQLQLSF